MNSEVSQRLRDHIDRVEQKHVDAEAECERLRTAPAVIRSGAYLEGKP